MSVAGRSFDQTFPAGANQQTNFVWDRLDAYGRQTLGGQTLSVTIDYNYPTSYKDPGPLPNPFTYGSHEKQSAPCLGGKHGLDDERPSDLYGESGSCH